jgi:hypothetical protein
MVHTQTYCTSSRVLWNKACNPDRQSKNLLYVIVVLVTMRKLTRTLTNECPEDCTVQSLAPKPLCRNV